jgi:hypothetical protein
MTPASTMATSHIRPRNTLLTEAQLTKSSGCIVSFRPRSRRNPIRRRGLSPVFSFCGTTRSAGDYARVAPAAAGRPVATAGIRRGAAHTMSQDRRPHGLAVRTPAFHAGDRRFESGWGYLQTPCKRIGLVWRAVPRRSCIEPAFDDVDIGLGLTKLTPGLDERALASPKPAGEQFSRRSDDRASTLRDASASALDRA